MESIFERAGRSSSGPDSTELWMHTFGSIQFLLNCVFTGLLHPPGFKSLSKHAPRSELCGFTPGGVRHLGRFELGVKLDPALSVLAFRTHVSFVGFM